MAKGTTFKVEGLKGLGEKLQAMGEDMTKSISRSASGAAAGIVKRAAEAKVPVRTGLLKSQIIMKRIPQGQTSALGATSIHVVTVRQGTKKRKRKKDLGSAPHAQLVEFGTVKMAAQPFLRPALDENVSAAIDMMAHVIRQKVIKS